MDAILKIAADRYDAGLGVRDPIALVWAAERAIAQIGVEATKAGVKQINGKRRRQGLIPVTFPFKHKLF